MLSLVSPSLLALRPPPLAPRPSSLTLTLDPVTETLIRSLEAGKFTLCRKLPKTESLADCMARTIPYFRDNIVPNSINQGKRVLIASSENAIRGLLMVRWVGVRGGVDAAAHASPCLCTCARKPAIL